MLIFSYNYFYIFILTIIDIICLKSIYYNLPNVNIYCLYSFHLYFVQFFCLNLNYYYFRVKNIMLVLRWLYLI